MKVSSASTTFIVLPIALLAYTFLHSNKVAHAQNDSETVIATYQVKPGKEDELLKVMARHWSTIHHLGMVFDQPHLVLRAKDDSGKSYFVEILTWVDSETPDRAPAEVRALWKEMEPLVEARNGHPAIDFPEVHVVTYPSVP